MMVPRSWWYQSYIFIANLCCRRTVSLSLSLTLSSSHPKGSHHTGKQRLNCGYWPIRRQWRWWAWRFVCNLRVHYTSDTIYRPQIFAGWEVLEVSCKGDCNSESQEAEGMCNKSLMRDAGLKFMGATGIAHLILTFFIRGRGRRRDCNSKIQEAQGMWNKTKG